MATLTFHGAVEGVTGSAYLLQTRHATILLECGLIQGRHEEEEKNRQPFPFDIHSIDAVVLSHAHLDHSGRLPTLIAEGYNGPIYMTWPTVDLLEILLKDAAYLEERDTKWENKRRKRTGKEEIYPLFTIEDSNAALSSCEGIPYSQRQKVARGIEVCFRDAGHILGSAIVELFIDEEGREKKLVFSGDLGNSYAALLKDPAVIEHANVLLLESTYGDRDHKPMDETLREFEAIISEAADKGGNVLIPSFAVGRTQEILFRLGELYQDGKLKQQEVYLDSPMAIATTEIYHRYLGMFNREDRDTMRQAHSHSLHTFLPILRYTPRSIESIALNDINSGAIIIAGSGMCSGGRIRHHFKHNLWRPEAHVIIVGFQAQGTPGRALVDGSPSFHVGGEDISVKAHVHTLGGFSAHASQSQLLGWAHHFRQPHPQLYLVHGEDVAKKELQKAFQQRGWSAYIPDTGERISF
ncbi:MAG: MBL fold metallo-hydrolase [Gammaproteobacteria bacterium]|nr:MBL fold metallo-hydrolase [Gammaproteobacteria bacterium]